MVKGLDFTALDDANQSELNQLVDAAEFADERGMFLFTTDTALSTPVVPDAETIEKYRRCFWIRKPHADDPDQLLRIYKWEPSLASAATYLRWVDATVGSKYGLILVTSDTASDTPDVPDAATDTKLQRFLWLRLKHADDPDKTPTLYWWNPAQASVATYLQWTDVVLGTRNGQTVLTTDTLLNTPDVPSVAATPELARSIWIRIPHSTATDREPILYKWDPAATSHATFLKWVNILNRFNRQRAVNTIELLRAIQPGQLADGDAVMVAGYYVPGDGGGGIFHWRQGDIHADDGGRFIKATADSAAGTFIRQIPLGWYNVKYWGAKGDGVTDDHTSIKNAIAAAELAAAEDVTGGADLGVATIQFPPAEYFVNSLASGTLSAGGYNFGIGLQASGNAITYTFIAHGAKIRNAVYQETGNDYRNYTCFQIGRRARNVTFLGMELVHEPVGSVTWTPTFSTSARPIAFYFPGDGSGTFVEGFTLDGCTIDNYRWSMRVEGSGYTPSTGSAVRRMSLRNCSFIGDGFDRMGAVLQGPDGGGGKIEELIITGNFFDGAKSGSVAGDSANSPAEGLVFFSNVKRAIIAMNVLKHFFYEGIYVTAGEGTSGVGEEPGEGGVQVYGNQLDGTPATSQASAGAVCGIRVDSPNFDIHDNTLKGVLIGVQAATATVLGTSGKRGRVARNDIQLVGAHRDCGVYVFCDDVDVVGNKIWCNTYSVGSARQWMFGVYLSAARGRVADNSFFSNTKNVDGAMRFYGVHLTNSASDCSIVRNRVRNLNVFALQNSSTSRFGENELKNCDAYFAAGSIGPVGDDQLTSDAFSASGMPTKHVALNWVTRHTLRWTPTAGVAAGWYKVACMRNVSALRLSVSADSSYGTFTDAAQRPMQAQADLMARVNPSGVIQGDSHIKQIHCAAANLTAIPIGAITQVRITQDNSSGGLMYAEVYLAHSTSPTEVVFEMESFSLGLSPFQTPEATASATARVTMNFVPKATQVISQDNNGGVPNFYYSGTSAGWPGTPYDTFVKEGSMVQAVFTDGAVTNQGLIMVWSNGAWKRVAYV